MKLKCLTSMSRVFIGHRDADTEIVSLLTEAVERHITEYGVTVFYVGNYGSFDRMAARAAIDTKKRHPSVTLWMLFAYHPYDRPSTRLIAYARYIASNTRKLVAFAQARACRGLMKVALLKK